MKKVRGELMDLGNESSASVHDEGPEIRAGGHRADKQSILITTRHMLPQSCISHVVVISVLAAHLVKILVSTEIIIISRKISRTMIQIYRAESE